MDAFSNYKKTLEDFLVNIDFIFSGDVLNSIDKQFYEKLNHSSFSAIFVKKVLTEIYNYSVESMFTKSEEIIIHRNSYSDIYDIMSSVPINPKILFYSQNSNINLNLGSHVVENSDSEDSYLPNYFTRRFKLLSHNREVSSYFCPQITDGLDDCHFYLVDKPIQSMVWSLQNMQYSINKCFSSNEHIIQIPFYNCNYKSYKVRVVNTQKLREDKINSILNDN